MVGAVSLPRDGFCILVATQPDADVGARRCESGAFHCWRMERSTALVHPLYSRVWAFD